MTGFNPQQTRDNVDPELQERGTRMPTHTAAASAEAGRLTPFMAAPIRPMETLKGLRASGWQALNQMIKINQAGPVVADLGYAIVPLSSLGSNMLDLVNRDSNDGLDLFLGTSTSTGTNEFRVLSTNNDTLFGAPASFDSPASSLVKRATYKIAETYYDVPRTGYVTDGNYLDDNQLPLIDHFIRGALRSNINLADVDNQIEAGDTVSDLAQKLSFLGKSDRTYSEYLSDQGVDVTRVQSLPEIVHWERNLLKPDGSPHMFGAASSSTTLLSSIGQFLRIISGQAVVGDAGGMAGAKNDIEVRMSKNFLVMEPSVLIGWATWWPFDVDGGSGDFSHYMDISKMVNPSQWGDKAGGLSEIDFIGSGPLQTGTSGITETSRAWNFLNLFLNGDSFVNDSSAFGFLGIADSALNDIEVNNFIMTQLAIATDLVS